MFPLLPLVLFMASCSDGYTAVQQARAAAAEEMQNTTAYVTMLRNTPISVTLADSIDTDVHLSGGIFRAILSSSIVADRHTVFEIGAPARGILSRVVESGGSGSHAEVHFSLTAIQDQSGDWIRIRTYTIQERTASSTSTKIVLIGGGGIIGGSMDTALDRNRSGGSVAVAGAATGPELPVGRRTHGIFHGIGTEMVFFSHESTRIALR